MLRRLTRTSVSVWVACIAPDTLTLRVRRRGTTSPETTAQAQPARVGANLWVTVLTAGAPGGAFTAGEIYEYELTAPWEASRGAIPWGDLSLPSATRPTFLAPPANAADLVVYHTSCRKPHGGGRDALALALVDMSTRFAASPTPQPHLLVLSGDQIYADEVGHPMMPRLLRVAKDLIGVDETGVFGPPPPVGGRGPVTLALGYTGATANQLWTYGEFMAMYLLAWSPVLWPATLPPFPTNPPIGVPDVDSDVSQESWDEDLANVELFRTVLPQVRRVLANVPSLMIFDDHEITDDWNIDLPWVNTVYDKPAGRRAVTNGVLAYALCQHWGNKPEAFAAAGTPERAVLDEVSSAVTASPRRSPEPVVRPLLGVPGGKLPSAPPAQVLRTLTSGKIRYDHELGPAQGWPVRIVLLDERTVREYPRLDSRAARISRDALSVQLPPPTSPVPFTIVVTASPALGSDLVENVIQPLLNLLMAAGARGARFADYESWSAVPANHQDLLARLAKHHPVVILSGDVHYGFTARMTRTEGGVTTRAAQLTASAAKNTEIKNAAISLFSELAMRLGLERVREESGFASLSSANQAKLLSPPPAGTTLPWDDLTDVLLGRVARDGVSAPTVLATPVAQAYGLPAPGWTYTVEPVDDSMSTFAAPAVDPPWDGWDPAKSLKMSGALQAADFERFARMFVGLPQLAVVTFRLAGSSLTVTQEIRCPAGSSETGPTAGDRHVLETEVALT
ncbi:MAG: hypothetical protein ACM3QU_09475 [Verrucomicrobiota bacterium]